MELKRRRELAGRLRAAAGEPDAGGAGAPAVPFDAMRSLAREESVALGDLERLALREGLVPARYRRNLGTIGMEGQLRLLEARAAVFGLGGLGGTVAELLARMGVGGLVLVDCDRFSDDNLNRQVLSAPQNLGEWKAEVAAERVAAVNPAVAAEAHCLRAGRREMEGLLAGCAVAVDALDNIPSRFELQAACAARGVPLVHGAVAGFCGQVMTVLPGDAGVGLLYREGEEHGVETATGNPAATPAVVAALQVQEVVKVVTGVGEPLRNRLLFVDVEGDLYEITEMS